MGVIVEILNIDADCIAVSDGLEWFVVLSDRDVDKAITLVPLHLRKRVREIIDCRSGVASGRAR